MPVTTLEGIVENGKVRLPEGIDLPDRQVVYVLVPDATPRMAHHVPGVRLANPDDAVKFEMKVSWGEGH